MMFRHCTRAFVGIASAWIGVAVAGATSPAPCLSPAEKPSSIVPEGDVPEQCMALGEPSCVDESAPPAAAGYEWHGNYSCEAAPAFKDPSKLVVVQKAVHFEEPLWFAIPRAQLPPTTYAAYGSTPFFAAWVVGGWYALDGGGQPVPTANIADPTATGADAAFKVTVDTARFTEKSLLVLFADGKEPEGYTKTADEPAGLSVYRRGDDHDCDVVFVARDTPWGLIVGQCGVWIGKEGNSYSYSFQWQLEANVVLKADFYGTEPGAWRKVVGAATDMVKVWRSNADTLPPKPDHER